MAPDAKAGTPTSETSTAASTAAEEIDRCRSHFLGWLGDRLAARQGCLACVLAT